MLADNINYLKKKDPMLYKLLKKSEENQQEPQVILEDAKNNQKTLKIKKDNKTVYLHSKYDPEKEAELIIDKLEEREEITPNTHVIFFGLGLGYHLDAFFRRFPEIEFSVYEPSVEVLMHYLNHKLLKNLPLKQLITIQCECDNNGMNDFFRTMITGKKKHNIICDLPPYEKLFTDEYNVFLHQFREVVKSMRSSMHTSYAFKQRWVLNSVINFNEVLMTPNILMENKGVFKNKIAILVSAGPSLDYEIVNLKHIKERGLAYIFTVGSAINTLIDHDLYPDAMCTYDPQEINQIAFTKVNDLGIVSIPMIFGSSVGFETLQEYQGPKYNMITSQDTVSNYFLKAKEGQDLEIVNDAPTIALVTLELLYKLCFSKIILVGQNFAYLNKKYYAKGIANQVIIDEKEDDHLLKILDVNGNEVFTNESLFLMKKQMEAYISIYNIPVINTTVGGADIEGSKFIPMSELIEQQLSKRILKGDEFKEIQPTDFYDKAYLNSQLSKIIRSYEDYQILLSLLKQQLSTVSGLAINRNTKQAATIYKKFDTNIAELESNDFAKIIALPMNRIEYQLLAMNVQKIKKEKNELKKIRGLVDYFEVFINLLYCDHQFNLQLIEKLKNTIEEYNRR